MTRKVTDDERAIPSDGRGAEEPKKQVTKPIRNREAQVTEPQLE
jgi:hypothetical protein